MEKKIIAIGGAVIKTAKKELRRIIELDKIEILIHNGGSIFHDFQQAIDPNLPSHSYPLNQLVDDYSCNKTASKLVWDWVVEGVSPRNSITRLCDEKDIDVLLFTGLGCDYWHLFGDSQQWGDYGEAAYNDLEYLVNRFNRKPFHYICMGSAVIHPEVFIKALSKANQKKFVADVVDFKEMYRPKTRVSAYGTYYKMLHQEFLSKWIKEIESINDIIV